MTQIIIASLILLIQWPLMAQTNPPAATAPAQGSTQIYYPEVDQQLLLNFKRSPEDILKASRPDLVKFVQEGAKAYYVESVNQMRVHTGFNKTVVPKWVLDVVLENIFKMSKSELIDGIKNHEETKMKWREVFVAGMVTKYSASKAFQDFFPEVKVNPGLFEHFIRNDKLYYGKSYISYSRNLLKEKSKVLYSNVVYKVFRDTLKKDPLPIERLEKIIKRVEGFTDTQVLEYMTNSDLFNRFISEQALLIAQEKKNELLVVEMKEEFQNQFDEKTDKLIKSLVREELKASNIAGLPTNIFLYILTALLGVNLGLIIIKLR